MSSPWLTPSALDYRAWPSPTKPVLRELLATTIAARASLLRHPGLGTEHVGEILGSPEGQVRAESARRRDLLLWPSSVVLHLREDDERDSMRGSRGGCVIGDHAVGCQH